METREGKRHEEYCKVRNQVRNLTRKAVVNKEKEIAKGVKRTPRNSGNTHNQTQKQE